MKEESFVNHTLRLELNSYIPYTNLASSEGSKPSIVKLFAVKYMKNTNVQQFGLGFNEQISEAITPEFALHFSCYIVIKPRDFFIDML